MKSYENSTMPIHSEGTSKERDERLADQGAPLGEAVEANKEKKLKGPNAPAT
ncbi:hypothetical protein [Thermoactinomyces sp. DSM 45892]|uniref:hypothetical protein n=1 Tax=Thermoactinomyces sp. DSM 45892 TaxID=1882753 RepID=UPI00089C86FC|nr:hypothetical protein [Thermoactinomyces sp. DSM 45892]SDY35226.1 hypothetical protein SAMN05444416_10412 [Thermoactinomyces sp. DSM 45892]